MKFIPSRKAEEILGVSANALRSWANAGKISSFIGATSKGRRICYCRVSSCKQKDDLERQVDFMRGKFPEHEIIQDIRAILESADRGDIQEVVVAHKDRLSRFGNELVRWIIENHGGELVVLDDIKHSPEEELTRDLLTIIHVFSCRLHGLGSYSNKIKKDQDLPGCQPEKPI